MERIGVTIRFGAGVSKVQIMDREGRSVARTLDMNALSPARQGNIRAEVQHRFMTLNPLKDARR